MDCPVCERLKHRLLQANLDHMNADSEMEHFARRSTIGEPDADTYQMLLDRLQNTKVACASVQREMADHELTHLPRSKSVPY